SGRRGGACPRRCGLERRWQSESTVARAMTAQSAAWGGGRTGEPRVLTVPVRSAGWVCDRFDYYPRVSTGSRPARANRLAVEPEPLAIASTGAEPIPLYFQIVSVLESRVLSGHCAPGSLLGTEKDFASEFGVSRITVTRAL